MIDPNDGPLHQFCYELHALKDKAGVSFAWIADYGATSDLAWCTPHTISRDLQPHTHPGRAAPWYRVRLVVLACGGELDHWQQRYDQLCDELSCRNDRTGSPPPDAQSVEPCSGGEDDPVWTDFKEFDLDLDLDGDVDGGEDEDQAGDDDGDDDGDGDDEDEAEEENAALVTPTIWSTGMTAAILTLFLSLLVACLATLTVTLDESSPAYSDVPTYDLHSQAGYDTSREVALWTQFPVDNPYDGSTVVSGIYQSPTARSRVLYRSSGPQVVTVIRCAEPNLDDYVVRLVALREQWQDIDNQVISGSYRESSGALSDEQIRRLNAVAEALRADIDEVSARQNQDRWYFVRSASVGDGWIPANYVWFGDSNAAMSRTTSSSSC